MASKPNNEIHALARARGVGSSACDYGDDDVLWLLRAAIERDGSQAAFAHRNGFDGVHLSMVLNGRRPVSSAILKALGLRKAYVAEPTDGANELPDLQHKD